MKSLVEKIENFLNEADFSSLDNAIEHWGKECNIHYKGDVVYLSHTTPEKDRAVLKDLRALGFKKIKWNHDIMTNESEKLNSTYDMSEIIKSNTKIIKQNHYKLETGKDEFTVINPRTGNYIKFIHNFQLPSYVIYDFIYKKDGTLIKKDVIDVNNITNEILNFDITALEYGKDMSKFSRNKL